MLRFLTNAFAVSFLTALPIFALTAWISLTRRKKAHKKANLFRLPGLFLFIFFAILILSNTITLETQIFPLKLRGTINIIPLVGIIKMARLMVERYQTRYFFMNLFGNIALFFPLGFLLPLLFQKTARFWKTLLICFAVSVLIESAQLVLPRGSDVDDVILNTLGGILGYLIYFITQKLFPKLVAAIRR